MRRPAALFLSVALILGSLAMGAWIAPAGAAPTCQTRTGDTIRCGAEGAMPVGWTMPPENRVDGPAIANPAALLKVILGLGLFFALIALMPQFDGSKAADWGSEEDDED